MDKRATFPQMGRQMKYILTWLLLLWISSQSLADKVSPADENVDPKNTTKVFSQGQNISYKAVLTHDPIGNLPKSFTICATRSAKPSGN